MRAWVRTVAMLSATLPSLVCTATPRAQFSDSTVQGPKSPAQAAAPKPITEPKSTPTHDPLPARRSVTTPKTVLRQPGETPEQLAARLLPPGATTITTPLEFEMPPLGKVVLVLYQAGSDDPVVVSDPSVYRGLVLVPDGQSGSYRIEPLPRQKDGAATLMYEVKSVFTADADADGAPELCVLSEITEAGTGDSGKPHTDTDLFKWSGSGFTLVEQGDKRPLYNLRNAKAVRARLKKIHH